MHHPPPPSVTFLTIQKIISDNPVLLPATAYCYDWKAGGMVDGYVICYNAIYMHVCVCRNNQNDSGLTKVWIKPR